MTRTIAAAAPPHRHTERAYSLVELLVAMLLLSLIMAALVTLFNASSNIAKTQTEIAEVQQSLRVAQEEIGRMTRMAGAGGLPLRWLDRDPEARITGFDYDIEGAFPNGFALEIESNVAEETMMPPGPATGSQVRVMPNTDILTVRGVMTSPVHYATQPVPLSTQFTMEIANTLAGRLYPFDAFAARIAEAVNDGRELAMIVRDLSAPDNYAVLQLNPGTTNLAPASCQTQSELASVVNGRECITIGLQHDQSSSPETARAFGEMTLGNKLGLHAGVPLLPLPAGSPLTDAPAPQQVSSVAILDEFRYFVRAEFETPGDSRSRLKPVLSRAEFIPGTQTMIERVDLVENILNMQVAVGFDADQNGIILDENNDEDEILFNDPADLASGVKSPNALTQHWWQKMPLAFVRLTLVAQARRLDRRYQAPELREVEDALLDGTFTVDGETKNLNDDRNFRRQIRQWTIDPRNIQ